jgi:hypothetical protein
VGVKANASASVTPLMVPSNPRDPSSPQVPLSIAMMKDRSSPYYAQLDQQSGQILNAQSLGLLTTGVGTGVTGLPLSQHQLGFVSPSGGQIVVRRAGERTTGYAERAYSLINRYQFSEGRLNGLAVGWITTLQDKFRGYMYTDAADGGKRKTFYFPNKFQNDVFAVYRFRLNRYVRGTVQVNVSNLFDENKVVKLLNSTNGTLRYAQWLNAPRKLSITTSWAY